MRRSLRLLVATVEVARLHKFSQAYAWLTKCHTHALNPEEVQREPGLEHSLPASGFETFTR